MSGRERPWGDVTYSPGVPTMITPEECGYLKWLGSVWRDEGHILEIGPWLGGSTRALAAGVEGSDLEPTHRLHTCDNFVWRAFMSDRAPLPLVEGQSFRPYFEENIRDWKDLIVVHEASLPDEAVDRLTVSVGTIEPEPNKLLRWRQGPIEILFIDGAKSWKALLHLLRETAGSLVPGALVVCQDYKYSGTYWVPLMIEMLRGHFALEDVLSENTASFRVTEPIEASDLEELPGEVRELARETGLEALDLAAARLRSYGDPHGALILEAAKVRFLGNVGGMPGALRVFRQVERRWPMRAGTMNLDRARKWLIDEGARVRPSSVYRLRRLPRKARMAVRR